ncbi:MAG: SusC/RagA family TonB-linked outer membrane protein [Odoribacteraceae bacterium]|jgi:TonB-linked SusC/RagA family outer membrane protein|nr:SusC/RagA family TonB-linked outer membrane protein [Odoribacteraceae bacterium]
MKKDELNSWRNRGNQKILLATRLLACMTLLPVFVVATPGFSQQRVSMKMREVALEQVLKEIQRVSGYYILYNVEDVRPVTGVSVEVQEATVEEVLERVLRSTSLRYVVEEETILITKRVTQSPERRIVRGVIRDERGLPVPGATIRVKGTMDGTASDVKGSFRLVLSAGDGAVVLLISCVGMEAQEVAWTGQEVINVVLKELVMEMSEVVVTGIFTRVRESYTGAVTTISAEELRRSSNVNILTQIANIDPAFNLLENNTYGSDPNRLPNIQMRGSTSLSVGMRELQEESQEQSLVNQPLFIVDGFEVNLRQVLDMDPSLVESVTLLKDASSTALYGSRGANGVVVISTKRPEEGQLRLSYRGDMNVEIPDLSSYDLMNAAEKLEFERLSGVYDQGGNPMKNQDWRQMYLDRLREVTRGVDTYWLKYPVRVGTGQRHAARVEGGNGAFRYAMHLGYNNILGAMKASRRSTFSGGMLLHYIHDNLTFRNELVVTFNKAGNSPYGGFHQYTRLNPYYTPYDEDGKLKKLLENRGTPMLLVRGNPLYDALLPYRDDNSYDQVRDNLAVDWRIFPGLVAKGRLSLTRQTGRSDVYRSAKHSSFEHPEYTGENFARRGAYKYGTNYLFRYEADVTLEYNYTAGDKHVLHAGLNYRVSEARSESHTVDAEGYTAEKMHLFGVANAYSKDGNPTSGESTTRALGGLLNVNYIYDNRYFADVSVKIDASSQFGARRRFAPFWSAGLGWNLHHESFLPADHVNSLRIRLSYGVSGSQKFKPYQAMTTFSYRDRDYRHWNGYYMIALGNDALRWETTGQLNIGLDAEVLDRRVRLRLDFYHKDTHDLLADVNTPLASGFFNYKSNIGKVRNRGVELGFTLFPWVDKARGISWSVGGTLVHNKNTVLKISDALEELNREINNMDKSSPSFLVKEGQSLNTIYAVKSLGIDPSNGAEVLVKADGTHVFGNEWNEEDKVPCGVADPKAWGTLNTMFRYGPFSCNVIFAYRLGADIYNQTLVDKVENVNPLENADRRAFYNRWKQPGDQAKFKGLAYYAQTTQATSRFVMREQLLECRSVNIAWDWTGATLRRLAGIDRLTMSAQTEDVFRFSTIRRERGTTYPFAHRFSLSLAARF